MLYIIYHTSFIIHLFGPKPEMFGKCAIFWYMYENVWDKLLKTSELSKYLLFLLPYVLQMYVMNI